jgi:hypothetical protein
VVIIGDISSKQRVELYCNRHLRSHPHANSARFTSILATCTM